MTVEALFDDFFQQASELLNTCDALLFEHGLNLSDDQRDELFRHIHTIKGAAGWLEVHLYPEAGAAEALAHALEEHIFGPDALDIELLLDGIGLLRQLIDAELQTRPAVFDDFLEQMADTRRSGATDRKLQTVTSKIWEAIFYLRAGKPRLIARAHAHLTGCTVLLEQADCPVLAAELAVMERLLDDCRRTTHQVCRRCLLDRLENALSAFLARLQWVMQGKDFHLRCPTDVYRARLAAYITYCQDCDLVRHPALERQPDDDAEEEEEEEETGHRDNDSDTYLAHENGR